MRKEEKMRTKLKAPPGMFRVVGLKLRNNHDYLVKDVRDKGSALKIIDKHHKTRSAESDVYYIYDDKGVYHPGKEAINRYKLENTFPFIQKFLAAS